AAMFGIVIVAGYLLFAMQKTLFGPFEVETDYEVGPAAFHDVAPLVVLILLVVLLGVDPNIFYGMIQDAVGPVVDAAGGGA
ncbi:oxidoreductase, partial [Halobacteriales archaeon SW_6_65_15]